MVLDSHNYSQNIENVQDDFSDINLDLFEEENNKKGEESDRIADKNHGDGIQQQPSGDSDRGNDDSDYITIDLDL